MALLSRGALSDDALMCVQSCVSEPATLPLKSCCGAHHWMGLLPLTYRFDTSETNRVVLERSVVEEGMILDGVTIQGMILGTA